MVRGRPTNSIVRNHLAEILFVVDKKSAYELHKHYLVLFGPISQRNIYYQLQKGVSLEEFEVEEIIDEKGSFSWGSTTRKVYYKLGKLAKPQLNKKVVEYFKKK